MVDINLRPGDPLLRDPERLAALRESWHGCKKKVKNPYETISLDNPIIFKVLRYLSDLTSAELADELGCGTNIIIRIENGESVGTEYLVRAAKYFGVSIEMLKGEMVFITVPDDWDDIYDDPDKQELITAMNTYGSKKLTRIFHEVVELKKSDPDPADNMLVIDPDNFKNDFNTHLVADVGG